MREKSGDSFTCEASDGFIRCAKSFVVRLIFVCYETKPAFLSSNINRRGRGSTAKVSNGLSFNRCSSSNFYIVTGTALVA